VRECHDQGDVLRGRRSTFRIVTGLDLVEESGVDGEVTPRRDGVSGAEAVTKAVAGRRGFAGSRDWSAGFGALRPGFTASVAVMFSPITVIHPARGCSRGWALLAAKSRTH
jgi:hypothetical protein